MGYGPGMHPTTAIDTILDRSVVLGYSRIGPALRRHWWPPDPPPGSMAGRRVLVAGVASPLGAAIAAGLSRLGADVATDPAEPMDRLDALIHASGGQGDAAAILEPHRLTDRLREPLARAGGIVTFVCSTTDARYARMQATLAQLWADRLRDDGVEVVSVHPGWVDGDGVAAPLMRSARQGADTVVWLVATRPAAGSGQFWHDRRPRSTAYGLTRPPDADQRRQFWDHVAQATGTAPWDTTADTVREFDFAFEPSYRLPALLFGVTPATAQVWLDADELHVRFGPWRLRTPRANIADWTETGDFSFVKTAGPAHLSLADHGVTFATNSKRAVCVSFHRPVPAIEPTGRLRHPGATITVADPQAFVAALESTSGRAG